MFLEANIQVKGKQNSVIKCFVIPPNSKLEKSCEEIVRVTPASSQICRGFNEHDPITCESKVRVVVPLWS